MYEERDNILQFPGGRSATPRVQQGAAKTIVTRELAECCLRIVQSLNVDLVPRGCRVWHIRTALQQMNEILAGSPLTIDAVRNIRSQYETSRDAAREAHKKGQCEGWQGNLWRAMVCRRVLQILATLEWANNAGKMPAPGAMRMETRNIIDALHRDLCDTLVNQPGALASVVSTLLYRHLPPEITPAACPRPASGEMLFSVSWDGKTRDLYLREE